MDGLQDGDIFCRAASAQVKKIVRLFVDSKPMGTFSLSFPGWHYDVTTDRNIQSFRCRHCDELIGKEVWHQLVEYGCWEQDASLTLEHLAEVVLWKERVYEDNPHWCYGPNKEFCS
jgi:hypothetical protein